MGNTISVTSAALNVGNISEIFFNEMNYAVNNRGLNIVVINNNSNKVIDSVCIDTHIYPYKFYRHTNIGKNLLSDPTLLI
ncbi:hypothetical protein EOM82_09885 [bacterium]|nr:hypothetical protein [bacterium]